MSNLESSNLDLSNGENNWCFALTQESLGTFDRSGLISPVIVRANGEKPIKTNIEFGYDASNLSDTNEIIRRMNERFNKTKKNVDYILALSGIQVI